MLMPLVVLDQSLAVKGRRRRTKKKKIGHRIVLTGGHRVNATPMTCQRDSFHLR